jgi:8-oxo-dGTP pyrophosphatase MutT (NUDIX family)
MAQNSRFDLFPVSVHILFHRGDSVLLVRRRGTGFCDDMYSVPAGHVMQAESILQAAAREAREEVGLEVSPATLFLVGTMYRCSTEGRIDFFVEARCWSGEPENKEPDKCSEVVWFPRTRLPNDTIPYVSRALQNNAQTPWFEEYLQP